MSDATLSEHEPMAENVAAPPAGAVAEPTCDAAMPNVLPRSVRLLGVLLPMFVLATAAAMTFEVESLIFMFPLCCCLAILFSFATLKYQSPMLLSYGTAPSAAAVFCMLLIAFRRLPPEKASEGIPDAWWLFTIVFLAWSIFANQKLGDAKCPGDTANVTWKFPMRYLFVATVILSVLLAIVSQFKEDRVDFFLFASISAVIISVNVIPPALFFHSRRRDPAEPGPNTSPFDS